MFAGVVGQPGVGTGVVLPEGTQITGLPAFDGLGGTFVTRVWSQFMFESPATNTGAVGLETESAMEFTGRKAIGTGRFGAEQFGEQREDCGRPGCMVIAPGTARRPSLGASLRTSLQVVGIQLVETRVR